MNRIGFLLLVGTGLDGVLNAVHLVPDNPGTAWSWFILGLALMLFRRSEA